MKSLSLSAEQRTYLYRKDRALWKAMLTMMRRSKRLEYPRGEVTITGPADVVAKIEQVLYG